MDSSTPSRATLLSLLAASEFRRLGKAETILFDAITNQDEADCSPGIPDADLHPDLIQSWTDDQTVRANFLRWLCLHVLQSVQNRIPVVSIRGARFTDHPLDLSNLTLQIAVTLQWCRFDYHIDVSESHFLTLELNNSFLPSLDAHQTTFDKDLSIEGLHSTGLLILEGARVGGDLIGRWAVLGSNHASCEAGPDGRCTVIFRGTDLRVSGTLFLEDCSLLGALELTGAKIDGDLDCEGSSLNGLGGASLILEKVEVDGGIFLSKGFKAVGPVLIRNALVKSGITADDAKFQLAPLTNKRKAETALRIENSLVQGISSFVGSFSSEGLSFQNSEFGFIQLAGKVGDSDLILENTKMKQFYDSEKSWPRPGKLHLDGFVYDGIHDLDSPHQILVSRRLRWLNLDSGRSSQPFLQLAKTLREHGDEDGATEILRSMEGRLIGDRTNVLDRMTGETLAPLGYGYSPQRSAWLLLGTVGLGWLVYRRNFIAGRITPTEADAYREFKSSQLAPPHYPKFSPLIYSLENTFPLVNLGQASKWQPDPCENTALKSSPETDNVASWRLTLLNKIGHFTSRMLHGPLRVFLWSQILIGWLLATLFVAGISGLIRK